MKPNYRWSIALALLLLVAVPFSLPVGVAGFAADRLLTIWIAASSGLAVIAACVGYGMIVVPSNLLRRDITFGLLLAFGCGAGILSCAVLAIGSIPGSGVSKTIGWLLVAAGLCIALVHLRPLLLLRNGSISSVSATFNVTAMAALLLLAVAAGLLFVATFTPPLLFDVTEYHLGGWRDNILVPKSAKFAPVLHFGAVPHNFYARFPFPIESIYWLGLVLSPPLDFAPKLINAAFVAACALLVSVMLRRANAARPLQLLGAALVLAHPVMREVSLDAYIDAPTAFLVAAAVFAVALLPLNAMPVAALLFGTALASKYTIAQLYLVPFLLLVVVLRGPEWRREREARMRILFLSLAAGLVPLVFWLGKNVVQYHNPLEPFFNWLFKPGDAAAVAREKFYISSHYPQPMWTIGYWESLLPRLREFGWIFLPLAAGILFLNPRVHDGTVDGKDSRPVHLLMFIGISYLLWNLVRESQARFLLPDIFLVIYLAVLAIDRLSNRCAKTIAALALILWAGMQLLYQGLTIAAAGEFSYLRDFNTASSQIGSSQAQEPSSDEPDSRQQFYIRNLGALGELLPAVRALPASAHMLLVYEARPYLIPRKVTYNTVWDDSELLRLAAGATTAAEIVTHLRAAGITHVLVNRQELRRYIQQYATPEQLKQLGVSPRDDAAIAFYATPTPEDFFPPFYRSPKWQEMRGAVLDFLAQLRSHATTVTGTAPLEIYLAPVP